METVIVFSGVRETGYGATAAITWMVWDTVINWDVELECIWQRPTSWVKAAYVTIRYLPVFHGCALIVLMVPGAQFARPACLTWISWELVFMEIVTLIVESILVIRIYILYNHNTVILRIVGLLFAAEIVTMISALAYSLPRITFLPNCLTSGSPSFFMAYWLSSLIFETFLFALTLAMFYKTVKRERERQSILHLFVRDGTWAFALIFVAMLLNMFLYKLEKTPLAGMGYFFELSVMSFAGSRILLNIRSLGIPQDYSFDLGSMHFATRTGDLGFEPAPFDRAEHLDTVMELSPLPPSTPSSLA